MQNSLEGTAISKKADTLPYKLPDERNSVVNKFSIAGQIEGYLIVGLDERESPKEIWIVISKEGSFTSGIFNAFAVTFSMALQYGVPLDKLLDKLEGQNFEPFGLSSNPQIGEVSSVIDYVSRYLRRFSRGQAIPA